AGNRPGFARRRRGRRRRRRGRRRRRRGAAEAQRLLQGVVVAEETIDLSGKAAEPEPEDKKKGRGSSAASVYTRVDRAERAWEKDLRTRLERTIQRLTEWLEGRGDEELAQVFREDG